MDGGPADGGPERAPVTGHEDGGDAVCWLELVCDACGGLPDGPPAPVCERCSTPRP